MKLFSKSHFHKSHHLRNLIKQINLIRSKIHKKSIKKEDFLRHLI